jgi:hypothetical protein
VLRRHSCRPGTCRRRHCRHGISTRRHTTLPHDLVLQQMREASLGERPSQGYHRKCYLHGYQGLPALPRATLSLAFGASRSGHSNMNL